MSIRELREAVEAGTLKPTDLVILEPEAHAQAWEAYKKGSLDAAKRLHDALLPEWAWGTGTYLVGPSTAKVWQSSANGHVAVDADPARAWLIAILRALEEEGRG